MRHPCLIFSEKRQDSRAASRNQCGKQNGNGKNFIQCADCGSGYGHGPMDCGSRSRARCRGGCAGGGMRCSGMSLSGSGGRSRSWRWHGTCRAGRTSWRQRRHFDCRCCGRFRRQIDADGFFFGLDLASFFFQRWHGASRCAGNVRRNVGHNVWLLR